MALRGTGSLHALLGRDATKRRPPKQRSASAASASAEDSGATASNGAGAPTASDGAAAAAAASRRPASPLKPGKVRCPVCQAQLPNDEAQINCHIDKCLSKGTLQKRTAQQSIAAFARPLPASQQKGQRSQPPPPQASGKQRRGDAAMAASAAAAATQILQDAAAGMEIDLTGDGDDSPGPVQQQRQQQQQQQQPAAQSPSVSWPSQDAPSSQDASQQQQQQQQQRRQQPHSPPSAQRQQQPLSPGSLERALRAHRAGRPAPAAAGALRCFPCAVVGRHFAKFQRHQVGLPAGRRLALESEPDNPKDSNAVLVVEGDSCAGVGYLPHVVTRHLAPLLRGSQVVIEAVVQEEPLADKAPLVVELQVAVQPPAPGSSPTAGRRVADALGRAEAAAAARLEQPAPATGERLAANFATVLDTCVAMDGHLLAELETGFIAAYKALPLPCQCLFLRLFQRKGPLFRLASLSYQDVPDAAAAAEQLEAAGLAVVVGVPGGGSPSSSTGVAGSPSSSSAGGGSGSSAAPDWRQLADLLPVPELAAVLAAHRFQIPGGVAAAGGRGKAGGAPRTRQQLLDALEHGGSARQLAAWLLAGTGPVIQLAPGACEAVGRLQRLFFLNEGQSLSQFIASDVGAMQYPQYAVHRFCSAFASRQDLLDYEAALRHSEELTAAIEEGDLEAAEAALAPAWAALDAGLHKADRGGTSAFLRHFHAAHVYCLMATTGVHLLERKKRYQDAQARLHQLLGGRCCLSRRGEWWERLAINSEHLKKPVQALEQTEAALADEWLSTGSRLALQRRWLRLGKAPRRWKTPAWADAARWEPPEVCIEGRPLNNTIGQKSRFYGANGEQCGVEELALQFYASEEGGGWQGTHRRAIQLLLLLLEGGIWATLFGLLLWDVLFMAVPDVFRTPFQTAPLDLDTPGFYTTRREAVEACLARVAAGGAPAMLRAAWERHRGALCRGVSWDRHTLEELELVAQCVGGSGLAEVCRLLAQDHAGWSGGMPDLLLWHAGRRQAKLAEVKGPRDRLSDQQRAWMAALTRAGLRAEVLKVKEPGKRKR